jgi:uncharacterized protein (DUF362 family)/Pyruvate/2-oxoacid:ferredoxin oxidoreductase delta subunit
MSDVSRVAIVRCERYEETEVFSAVGRALDLLGGADRFVTAGERIVLKPNLLVASAPDACVTTHPTVFSAVARHLLASGAELSFGDSPGFGGPEWTARRSGLGAVADRLGIPFADFSAGRQVSFPEGALIKQFTIANGVLDADGLVSIAKFKTHGLARLTGAVKNQFGCVPGVLKGEFHARMPDVDRFSQMLVDLDRCIAPRLYVIDGIIAMEGNGPRSGTPRQMSVLIVSEDGVAADATMASMTNLDPELVGTVFFGQQAGHGTYNDIEYVGDLLEEFVAADYAVNRSRGSVTGHFGWKGRLARDWIVPKPVIDPAMCTACGTCVKVCPVEPKAVDWADPMSARDKQPPVHDYARCIRCYCCQELCPEKAIGIETPFLGRLIHRR